MSTATNELLHELLGASVVARTTVQRGYTPAERTVVQLADGRSVFVKAAVNEMTAEWLRSEHRVYSSLRVPFLADMLAWRDGPLPILVLEDLSRETWPAPWTPAQVDALLKTMREVAATPPPPGTPAATASGMLDRNWPFVREDPAPLLSTGVVPPAWLERYLPAFLEAAAGCRVDGSELLHLDVRSDNVCFRADGSPILVDWNLAVVGNARLDIAFWLPSLEAEGGPAPDGLLTDAGLEAAFVSGFFAARAGQAPVPGAPGIRPLQLVQLRHALPWACRALGIPEPETGPRA